jgi:hypothetical protein
MAGGVASAGGIPGALDAGAATPTSSGERASGCPPPQENRNDEANTTAQERSMNDEANTTAQERSMNATRPFLVFVDKPRSCRALPSGSRAVAVTSCAVMGQALSQP